MKHLRRLRDGIGPLLYFSGLTLIAAICAKLAIMAEPWSFLLIPLALAYGIGWYIE